MMHDHLTHLLDYDPKTGHFTWKNSRSRRIKPGQRAGSAAHQGYRAIHVEGRRYPEHRLAWFYTHGEWPNPTIDHINGNRSDNRLENLRVATRSEQKQNTRAAYRNNKSGYLGVIPKASGKFEAWVTLDKRKHYAGRFDTAEEAHEAYVAAKRRVHRANTL